MKTIEEGALEHINNTIGKFLHKDTSFKAGVKFAQRWISVDDELPLCYESGDWDGLRSELVLVKDNKNKLDIVNLYSGILDGFKFNDWITNYDYQLVNITHWRPIELS